MLAAGAPGCPQHGLMGWGHGLTPLPMKQVPMAAGRTGHGAGAGDRDAPSLHPARLWGPSVTRGPCPCVQVGWGPSGAGGADKTLSDGTPFGHNPGTPHSSSPSFVGVVDQAQPMPCSSTRWQHPWHHPTSHPGCVTPQGHPCCGADPQQVPAPLLPGQLVPHRARPSGAGGLRPPPPLCSR